MKQITCEAMGGPKGCTTVLHGRTAEEIVMDGMDHIEKEHPEMAKQIKSNSEEENKKWMEEFNKKFDALPEA